MKVLGMASMINTEGYDWLDMYFW